MGPILIVSTSFFFCLVQHCATLAGLIGWIFSTAARRNYHQILDLERETVPHLS